jgi:hypothetical protein
VRLSRRHVRRHFKSNPAVSRYFNGLFYGHTHSIPQTRIRNQRPRMKALI